MNYVFLGIASIVVANVSIGFLAKNYHALSSVLAWMCFGTVVSLIWARHELSKRSTYLEIKKSGWSCFWFFALSIFAPLLYFLGVRDAGLGVTSVISNAKLGVLIIISFIVFKEKPSKLDLFACLLLLPGFALLTEVKDLTYNWGLFLAALSMLCYAGQNTFNKILSFEVPYRAMVAIRGLSITAGISLYCFLISEPLDFPLEKGFLVPIIVGSPFGILVSKYADFKALETVPFFTFSIWQPLRPALIIVASAVLLNEQIDLLKGLGCLLLVSSSVVASFSKR